MSPQSSAIAFVANNIFALSFAISILILLVCAASLFFSDKISPMAQMGSATWDFNRNWASNLTVMGALLAIALNVNVLPKSTLYLSKASFGLFVVIFLGFVAVAPFVYTIFSIPYLDRGNSVNPNSAQLISRGKVVTFLLASILTSWGVIGELGILSLIFEEVRMSNIDANLPATVFEVLMLFSILGLLLYLPRSICWTVRFQTTIESFTAAEIGSDTIADNRPRDFSFP